MSIYIYFLEYIIPGKLCNKKGKKVKNNNSIKKPKGRTYGRGGIVCDVCLFCSTDLLESDAVR